MSQFSALDHAFMAEALRLAERGAFTTRPNPMVGCVIAESERVLGRGWHEKAGGPHAEVFALREAGAAARGATAYVTLEPCAHHGRTPPCADALVAAGIARVVVAAQDSFAKVDGKGLARLREAGIEVQTGLMEATARSLNRGFFSRIERGRPWLRIKLAMSLDGRTALANGESKWISSAASRCDVMQWRARSSALLTGAGTVLADDPQLTVRLDEPARYMPPLRVVLDTNLRSLAPARIRDGAAPTLYLHDAQRRPPLDEFNAEFQGLPLGVNGQLDIDAVLALLAGRGINEVQVEAGATLAAALLTSGRVDELLVYIAPVLLGERGRPLFDGLGVEAMTQRFNLRLLDTRQIGQDLRLLLQPETQACSPD